MQCETYQVLHNPKLRTKSTVGQDSKCMFCAMLCPNNWPLKQETRYVSTIKMRQTPIGLHTICTRVTAQAFLLVCAASTGAIGIAQ